MKAAIGIDPGPTPGFGFLIWNAETGILFRAEIVQCSMPLAPVILEALLDCLPRPGEVYVQGEAFVVGHRAGRSKTPKGGKAARELVAELRPVLANHDLPIRERNASQVKAWSTDDRLKRAGLLELAVGSTHARDGLRHALFTACRDGGLADPLSKEWKARR